MKVITTDNKTKKLSTSTSLIKNVLISSISFVVFGFAVFSITELSIAQVSNKKETSKIVINQLNTPEVLPVAGNSNKELFAQIPFNQVKFGSLFFKSANGYFSQLSQNSDYRVEVNGLLARVYFSQTFTNDSDDYLEAVYVFPLSEDAAVDAMVMEIGERRIHGSIKEKQQAKKLYLKAKQQGKKASLVSQQRPNMFTTKVANIAPHQSIKISLSYLQAVNFANDEFSLRLPLTITPRYIVQPKGNNRTLTNEQQSSLSLNNNEVIKLSQSHGWAINNTRVPDASEITPPQISKQERIAQGQKVSIAVKLNSELPLIKIKSSYHKIYQSHATVANNQSVVVTLANNNALLEQDFELHWQLANGQSPQAAFFSDSDDNSQYGLLMLMPPKGLAGQTIAKEVIYIIDVSGSMGGVAIKQAKLALAQAVDLLTAQDSFNIIAFNDQSQLLFRHSQQINDNSRYRAKQWIAQLQAGGGTNMLPVIELALAEQHTSGDQQSKLKQVIFITDGAVGNEAELFNVMDKKLNKTRLHTVGIGSAPNGYFMRQAAETGRGTYRYIGKINEVQQKMQQLFDEISRPMMTDIEIDWPSDQVEIFPQQIPDLYAGQPMVVSVKWHKKLSGGQNSSGGKKPIEMIKISGQLSSQSWQQELLISSLIKKTSSTKDNRQNLIAENVFESVGKQKFNGISTWWGRQKIKHLTQQYRRSYGEQQQQLQRQITNLALKHSLLSKFTSFVAIEDIISRPKEAKLNSQAVANLMPKGSMQMVPLANTALGILSYMYLGTALLVIALFLALLSLPQWLILQRRLKKSLKKTMLLLEDKR